MRHFIELHLISKMSLQWWIMMDPQIQAVELGLFRQGTCFPLAVAASPSMSSSQRSQRSQRSMGSAVTCLRGHGEWLQSRRWHCRLHHQAAWLKLEVDTSSHDSNWCIKYIYIIIYILYILYIIYIIYIYYIIYYIYYIYYIYIILYILYILYILSILYM